MSGISIRTLADADREWARSLLRDRWGGETVVVHGRVFKPADLPGVVAIEDGEPVGLLTFFVGGDDCEIVTLDSLHEGRGVGTILLQAVRGLAASLGCERVVLTTTNDNEHALGFYQRRGFQLVAVREGAVAHARVLKPEIPDVGANGAAVVDELELEIRLG